MPSSPPPSLPASPPASPTFATRMPSPPPSPPSVYASYANAGGGMVITGEDDEEDELDEADGARTAPSPSLPPAGFVGSVPACSAHKLAAAGGSAAGRTIVDRNASPDGMANVDVHTSTSGASACLSSACLPAACEPTPIQPSLPRAPELSVAVPGAGTSMLMGSAAIASSSSSSSHPRAPLPLASFGVEASRPLQSLHAGGEHDTSHCSLSKAQRRLHNLSLDASKAICDAVLASGHSPRCSLEASAASAARSVAAAEQAAESATASMESLHALSHLLRKMRDPAEGCATTNLALWPPSCG